MEISGFSPWIFCLLPLPLLMDSRYFFVVQYLDAGVQIGALSEVLSKKWML